MVNRQRTQEWQKLQDATESVGNKVLFYTIFQHLLIFFPSSGITVDLLVFTSLKPLSLVQLAGGSISNYNRAPNRFTNPNPSVFEEASGLPKINADATCRPNITELTAYRPNVTADAAYHASLAAIFSRRGSITNGTAPFPQIMVSIPNITVFFY